MTHITVIGMDISKRSFHLVGLDEDGKLVLRKHLKRHQLLAWFARQKHCVVSMEACASAHYWARELIKLGYKVKLLPAQHVKAFVQGNKNDYNDALAIAEATCRPRLHEVAVKSIEQQDIQAMQRMRAQSVAEQTALCNQTRGLLGENGIVVPRGVNQLKKALPGLLEDGENGLSDTFRCLLRRRQEQLIQQDKDIKFYTQQLHALSNQNPLIQRLQTIPGFGPIVASAFHAYLGSGEAFNTGRGVAASLGLVPRQHSTGGKQTLMGISKRGDHYLRALLIHGARSVVRYAHKHTDRLSRWVGRLVEQRGINKATVALANKLARIGWAMTTKGGVYESFAIK